MTEPDRKPMPWLVIAIVTAVMLGGWAWFTWGKDSFGVRPTMTQQQAIDRVEKLIKESVTQLPATARLEIRQQDDDFPCDDPTDGGPRGRVIIEHDYWIRGLPVESFEKQFDTLQRYWNDRGDEQIRFDTRPNLAGWEMVHTDPDGFRIFLGTTGSGEQLLIGSQSPCVWPHGTPEPES